MKNRKNYWPRACYFLCSIILIIGIPSCIKKGTDQNIEWSLMMERPGSNTVEVLKLPNDLSKPFAFSQIIDGIKIQFELIPKSNYTVFKAIANSVNGESEIYFSLSGNYKNGKAYNFNGEVDSAEIFRQSPHDIDAWIVKTIAEQAVPVIALKTESKFAVALNSSPALYDNFTSQEFYPEKRLIKLSSGDSGNSPGIKPDTSQTLKINYNAEAGQKFTPGKVKTHFHKVSKQKSHVFEGILFECKTDNFKGLRRNINMFAANHFSNGKYKNYFGALAFTTAYMNLRTNDSKKSNFWVVPSVEYANTQYGRDAFWIATMLSPQYDSECMKSELAAVNPFAEYPLFAVIWAYRAKKAGAGIEIKKVQAYVNLIETRSKKNYYHSYDPKAGRLDFQYWGDVMAFEKDDIITFNQGLFALSLMAARELGLKINSDPEKAVANYKGMFNSGLGFYPISKKKNTIMGPDPLAPDLLSQIYFGKKLLESANVKKHFDRMVKKSKTKYGFKIVSDENGQYLQSAMYDVKGYISQVNLEKMPDGRYFRGGSYFLYDNLFLIDAYLHGIKNAEKELIERVSKEFMIGNTTYECLNTKTGEPWKPNMGWNVAIYAFWQKLVDEKKADNKLFDKIDQISKTESNLLNDKIHE